ncbi:MAG: hypothetical protein EBZ69_01080 [Alphaproteobacteria bacterium]|nr:hypothetical protein [Alphaproteobacteria bacterium]NDG03899.1 hypothetical protein [Alphaproteobacteria bacterium]
MDLHELAERVEKSARLRKLRAKFIDELQFRSDVNAQFDPMLIIMIISILVQVIIHCRENRTRAQLAQDIREIRELPARRLIRLRRRLNNLWREHGVQTDDAAADGNPLLTAVYEIAENMDIGTIKELVDLAEDS